MTDPNASRKPRPGLGRGLSALMGDIARRGIGAGIVDMSAQAQPGCRDREHTAKLATPKNADDGVGGKRGHGRRPSLLRRVTRGPCPLPPAM